MQTFKIGDRVAVLHETLTGTVIGIDSWKAAIRDDDGFVWQYPLKNIVLKPSVSTYRIDDRTIAKDYFHQPQKRVEKLSATHIVKERPEIDLHIEELREDSRYLTNYEIVQAQMTACRAFVQSAIAENKKKIVLIHGKGEGVLKSEIHQYLDRLSNNQGVKLDYHDASYQHYGMGGATEVVFYGG